MKLLSIETSCDETAVAVLDLKAFSAGASNDEFLLADLISSQAKLHEAYGGVVPELASREHLKNLPLLLKDALDLAHVKVEEISAVAVTQGPGLKGCLLVGLSFAKAFAQCRTVPLIPVNHLEGHLRAASLLMPNERVVEPYLALVVSGGHTFLVRVEKFRRYQILAETRDDAAGEAFDKTASLLGLPYPGGPQLAKLGEGGDPKRFSFPISLPGDHTAFSFSGLKTAVYRSVEKIGASTVATDNLLRRDLAASIESAIVENLLIKVLAVARSGRCKDFLLTGGVAANLTLQRRLREELSKLGMRLVVPPTRWCTDNAAMIGIVAAEEYLSDRSAFETWRDSPVGLGPSAGLDLTVLPRWSIDQLRGIK